MFFSLRGGKRVSHKPQPQMGRGSLYLSAHCWVLMVPCPQQASRPMQACGVSIFPFVPCHNTTAC